MLKKKKVIKELVYLYIDKIDSSIIVDIINFVGNMPKSEDSRFTDKSILLINYIKIGISGNKPKYLNIGINYGGTVKELNMYQGKYYYYSKDSILEIDDIEKVKL